MCSVRPQLSATATSGSPVGSYPISMAQGTLSDPNYSFGFGSGTLTVGIAALTITGNSEVAIEARRCRR